MRRLDDEGSVRARVYDRQINMYGEAVYGTPLARKLARTRMGPSVAPRMQAKDA